MRFLIYFVTALSIRQVYAAAFIVLLREKQGA